MTRSFSGKSMAGDLLLVVAGLCLCVVSSVGELARYEHPIKSDGSLRFLAVGDWGRKGTHNQSLVAYQMGIIGEKLEIDFVISTGDNFYDDGLKSVQDTAFEESFTNIYTAESLNKPWYTVLGNHDYRGDALAQISPILKNIDRRWFCYKSFLLNAEIAEFFFVDTTPFVEKYFTEPKDHVYDWRGVSPRGHYIAKLLKDLESSLSESSARWKIVVGHHAIRSAGHHGDTKELVDLLLPLLKAYDVDFYINGHDHCLEHISDDQSSIQFLTSGGGSKAWRGDVKYNHRGLKLFYDGQGFMSVKLTETDAEIIFYDVFANVLHQWKRHKQVYSAI